MQNTLLKNIRIFLFLLAFNYSCYSYNEYKGDEKIGSALLRNDFKILRATLQEAHPGLYWYSSKSSMDHYFDSLNHLIDHDMTRVEFFKMLLPLIAHVKCVHTNLRMADDAGDKHFKFTRLLPFNFFCINGKLYIKDDFSNTSLSGKQVASINGYPSKKIIDTLLNSLPADGYNETYKYYLLNKGVFREGYAAYFDQRDKFIIEVLNPDNRSRVLFTIKAKTPHELPVIKENASSPQISIKFENNLNTAILTINTFEINSKNFGDTIATIFKTLKEKRTSHLIIDIRQNGGGNNDNIPALFSYIATDSFLHLRRAEMKAVSFTYTKYFKNPNAFQNLGGIAEPSGYLMNYRYAGTAYKQPAKNYLFTGDVSLLISGHTSSAASEFAAITRYHKRANIIGEEAGGGYYGATGGIYINLILPASKLEVRIPTIRIFTAVADDVKQPKGRGTLPDYTVVPRIEDLMQGRDVELEKAFELIRNN